MAGLCKAVIIGHLGRDPETRSTAGGTAVTNFSVAATERYKGEDQTEWFRVAAFGKLGEICAQYLKKGKQVYIEGRLKTSEWQDKDGKNRFSLEIMANTVQMLGTKVDSGQMQAQTAPIPQQTPAMEAAIAEKNRAVHGAGFGDNTDSEKAGVPDDIPF